MGSGEGRNDGRSNRAERDEMQWRGRSNGFLPKELSTISLHSIHHKQLSETACMAEVSEVSKEKGR